MARNIARDSHEWKRLRKSLLKQARANQTPCAICGMKINYKTRDYNAPDAPTVDHVLSWRDHPELRLDRGNTQICHRSCNTSRGVKMYALPTSGNTSRDWSLPQGEGAFRSPATRTNRTRRRG